MPKLEKPLLVKDIGQFYIDRRKPSKDEKRKVESVWKEFCQIIPCKTIREITSNMIYDYYDKISRQYKENNFASSWLKSRFARIKTVLNYSKKYGRTNKRELSRVLEWCQCLSVPSDTAVNPNPISKEDVHQLLDIADIKWKAMILLALNCGYYAKDIHDLKKAMIKSKDNLYYIVFPREKNKHMRVNVLWQITYDAVKEYILKYPNESEHVFSNKYKRPLDPHDVQRGFDKLRKKAKVDEEVKFCHFRDGAATALFGKVNSDLLKITIGHRIKGEKSKYIAVKPEQVQVCADYIWKEYFGEIKSADSGADN